MAIDNLAENRNVNIKDLTVSEASKKAPFVPERDITPEMWGKWTDYANSEFEKTLIGDVREGIKIAGFMTILFPQRKKDLHLPTVTKTVEALQSDSIPDASSMQILYPAFRPVFAHLLPEFQTQERLVQSAILPDYVWDTFILFPEKWDQILNKPKLAEHWKRDAAIHKENNGWVNFAESKLAEKLLGGNTAITDDEWREMLQHVQRGASPVAAPLAGMMKLLSAEKIEMTEKGLEIELPKPESTFVSRNSMPEGRKF